MNITAFAIRHFTAVVVLCVGLVIVGTVSYVSLPRENFPDIEMPVIFVTTVLDGANPTDIEASVTIPLETELDGLEGMKEMRSSSAESLSTISIEFHPEVATQTALQRVRDAVDIGKGELPAEADEPVIQEFTFSSLPVLIYQLVGGDRISLSELQDLAERLEDRIRVVPGVLDVHVYGGREREVRIEVDPDRLHFFRLSLPQVEAVLRGSNRNVSAGSSDNRTNRIVMRAPGEYRNPGEIASLAIGRSPAGQAVYLGDIATVRYDFEDEKTRARTYDFVGGGDRETGARPVGPWKSVSVQITKRAGANILAVTEGVAGTMAAYPFPAHVRVIKALDQSKDVRLMLSDLENGILTALILIVTVIFIGLGGRNAVLVALAVPFSMLMSFIIIQCLGMTLNMIVLFSLILALGMLVDNAIVIIENIYRRLSLGGSRVRAAVDGTAEMAWPVITSTATTVGAFLPLVFWPGTVGKFMGYLPRTVIIVLLSSLFVALVINPTLAVLFMRVRPRAKTAVDPETERPTYPLVRAYRRGLEFMLRRPLWTIATAVVLMILTFATYAVFGAGQEFFPDTDPPTVTGSIKPPEGTSLEASDRLAARLEARIFGRPGSGYRQPVANLKHASVTVALEGAGGGFWADDSLGPVQVQLEFVDRDRRTEPTTATLAAVRRRIAGLDATGRRVAPPLFGAEFDVVRPQAGPPTGKPISIDIFGEDLGRMSAVIRDMKRLMANTEGAAKPTDNASTSQPTLEWIVDRPRASLFGLDQATVGKVLQVCVGGMQAGTYGHGDDEQDIVMRLPAAYRVDTDRLGNVHIPTPLGGSTPLVSVAAAKLVPGPVAIRHYNRKRVLTAGAEVQPGVRADATVRQAFQRQAAQYPFPAGITYRFGGAAEEQEAAAAFLTKAFVVTVFIIVVILVLQFNSVLVSGIVMTSVVLSLMGVFMGLLALRAPFGIVMTGIGVISLAGVVVNNAIVLLDAIRRFERLGHGAYDAVVTAAMIRFRPVLLTAVTTILGLVPMALKVNFDFRELAWQYNTMTSQFWQSMASAVIFGLLVATVMTLGVVPTLYLLYARCRDWARRRFGFGLAEQEVAAAFRV